MAIKDAFIAELKHESLLTKKMLGKVPLEKGTWKPHEKSMVLGRLATHIAEIPHWISDIINIDEFDFSNPNHFKAGKIATSQEELMNIFQEKIDKAIADLEKSEDEEFSRIWTIRMGEKIMLQTKKKIAIRSWGFSHFIHHRGQLSVYLRLLDIPVPGMYGPSADER